MKFILQSLMCTTKIQISQKSSLLALKFKTSNLVLNTNGVGIKVISYNLKFWSLEFGSLEFEGNKLEPWSNMLEYWVLLHFTLFKL